MRDMKNALSLAIVLLGTSCKGRADVQKQTPAQVTSSLVGDVSPLDSAAAMIPRAGKQEPWDPTYCAVKPEPDEGASLSELTFSGTCAFHHRDPAACRAEGDDYYIILRHQLADGNEAEIFINVEHYAGAKAYEKKAEVLFLIRRNQSLYRWAKRNASVTLSFQEGGLSSADSPTDKVKERTPTVAQMPPTELVNEPGTSTSGKIVLSGTVRCVVASGSQSN
jgi:hypothetical protein